MDRLSTENSPVSRNEWPRPSLRMSATKTWLTQTYVTAAASPATAKRASGFEMTPPPWSRISWITPHIASAFSV